MINIISFKTIGTIIILILLVEIFQFLTFSGSADIDDIILNTIGAIIGYIIVQSKFVKKILKIEE